MADVIVTTEGSPVSIELSTTQNITVENPTVIDVDVATAPKEIEEYATYANFPVTGVVSTLYITIDAGYLYRWTGTVYQQIGGGAALEVDPIFIASPAFNITTQQVTDLHAPGSDNQDLSGKENVGVASGLVSGHEGTYDHTLLHAAGSDNQDLSGKENVGVAAGLDTDHTNAFTHSNINAPGSDNQDLSGYALKNNVLELDNVTAFTPDADYEPATKKYVDDLVVPNELTSDELAAINGAATPSAANVFATIADVPSIAGLLDEIAHDGLDHAGLTGIIAIGTGATDAMAGDTVIPSIAGLLDETAHDQLDHAGLTGIHASGSDDEVFEYANLAAFPGTGVAGVLYVALDTNLLYRWDTGTAGYIPVSSSGGGDVLTGNVEYYIHTTTGSDITGDGSFGTPWKTLQYAINQIPKNLNTYLASIYTVDNGTYNAGGTYIDIIGFSHGRLNIYGNGSTYTSTGTVFRLEHITGLVYLTGMKFTLTNTGAGGLDISNCPGEINLSSMSFEDNGIATGTYAIDVSHSRAITVSGITNLSVNKVAIGFNLDNCIMTGLNEEDVGDVFIHPTSSFINLDNDGFLRSPESAPTVDYQYANKKYVDDSIAETALTGDVSFAVSTTGSDTTGDGSIGNPFLTIPKALSVIPKNLGGYTAVVYIVNDGTHTYSTPITVEHFFNGVLIINGEPSQITITQGIDLFDCIACDCNLNIGSLNISLLAESAYGMYIAECTGLIYLYNVNIDSDSAGYTHTIGIQVENCANLRLFNIQNYNSFPTVVGFSLRNVFVSGLSTCDLGTTLLDSNGFINFDLNTGFLSSPEAAPTLDYQYANKKYVDDEISGIPVPPNELTSDELAAINGAASPSATNVFTTMDDISLISKLTLGANNIINGTFDVDTNWTKGTNWAIGDGSAGKASPTASNLSQTVSTIVTGKFYKLTYDANISTSTLTPSGGGWTGQAVSTTTTGIVEYFYATSSAPLTFAATNTTNAEVDNVILQEIIGIHAFGADNQTASTVAVTTTSFGGILANGATSDTVQECLDLIDDHTHTASDITNVPYDGIVSTNVQAAINEIADKISTESFEVTAIVTNQSYTGTIADLQVLGGTAVIVTEDSGVYNDLTGVPLRVELQFDGVDSFSSFHLHYAYYKVGGGATTHNVNLEIYNTVLDQWDTVLSPILTDAELLESLTYPVASGGIDYISADANERVRVRFNHTSNGVDTHRLKLDDCVISKGITGVIPTVHGALGGRSDADQHPISAITGLTSLVHTQNTDTGTTGNTFTVDSDSTTGKIIIDVALDAADKSLTLTNAALTDDRVITFPNVTGTVALTSDLHAVQTASTVAVTTSAFAGILTNDAASDTVQECLDKIDDHTHTETDPVFHTYSSENHVPSGFHDHSLTTLALVENVGAVNDKFSVTITGTNFPVYINGHRIVKNTETVTQVGATTRRYFVYYDAADDTLKISTTGWDLDNYDGSAPVCTVYWDATNHRGRLEEERHHSWRDVYWHHWAHHSVGTRYSQGHIANGLNITTPAASGDITTFSITAGDIYDEDIQINIGAHTVCDLFYHTADGTMVFERDSTTLYKATAGVPQYDNGTGLAGKTQSNSTGYFVSWVYATNAYVAGPDANIAVVVGQDTNGTMTLAEAQSAALPSLPVDFVLEWKLCWKIIWRYGLSSTTWISNTDYRTASSLPSGQVPATNVAANAVTFSPIGNIAATNVQTALEEVDTEKAPIASPTFTGTVTLPVGLTGVLRADTGVVSVDTDVTDIVTAATTSAAGKVEIAIDTEVNTGTDATRAISPDALAGSNFGIRYISLALNGTTALTTSDKAYIRIPAGYTGMDLISVTGSVGTGAAGSSSSGTPTFTVKNVTDNNQMLSTSLTIDANEYTSASAATPAVIDTAKDDVVTDDLIEVACTTAGTGTTYAVITLGFRIP